VNRAWNEAANNFPGRRARVGEDYVEACERESGGLARLGKSLAGAIREVISGACPSLELTHEGARSAGEQDVAVRIARSAGKKSATIVVSHAVDAPTPAQPSLEAGLEAFAQLNSEQSLAHFKQVVSAAMDSLRHDLAAMARSLQQLREKAQIPEDQLHVLDEALRCSHQSLPLLHDIAQALQGPSSASAREQSYSPADEEQLHQFIGRLQEAGAKFTRRREVRHAVALPVDATPVDASLYPLGPVLQAVTRDISTSGISLLCTTSPEAKYLAISLWAAEGQRLDAVVEVLRCRPLGPMFDLGGRFVTKIHGLPRSKKRKPAGRAK
jgi:hypothetical protein